MEANNFTSKSPPSAICANLKLASQCLQDNCPDRFSNTIDECNYWAKSRQCGNQPCQTCDSATKACYRIYNKTCPSLRDAAYCVFKYCPQPNVAQCLQAAQMLGCSASICDNPYIKFKQGWRYKEVDAGVCSVEGELVTKQDPKYQDTLLQLAKPSCPDQLSLPGICDCCLINLPTFISLMVLIFSLLLGFFLLVYRKRKGVERQRLAVVPGLGRRQG